METPTLAAVHDGQAYRSRREAAGLSREDVIRRANVSLSTVLRAEARSDWKELRVGLVEDLEAALAGGLPA